MVDFVDHFAGTTSLGNCPPALERVANEVECPTEMRLPVDALEHEVHRLSDGHQRRLTLGRGTQFSQFRQTFAIFTQKVERTGCTNWCEADPEQGMLIKKNFF